MLFRFIMVVFMVYNSVILTSLFTLETTPIREKFEQIGRYLP